MSPRTMLPSGANDLSELCARRAPALAAMAARATTAQPPSEARLVETLSALRSILLPSSHGALESPRELAEAAIVGLHALLRSVRADSDEAAICREIDEFLSELPSLAELLAEDVRAAYDGDPAAVSEAEIVLCYPGIRALFVHRVAHALARRGVPTLPRMMAEYAHRETGIDIHPKATIGRGVFIDHGTGVVIGETAVVGDRCRIYQGVTLGARSFDREPDGSMRRGYKRHPTLESDVVVYAGATILGGDTVIGRGSIVSGGVFLTQSVPPGHLVAGPRLELRVRSMGGSI
jgi:serine O-acetyltransferase